MTKLEYNYADAIHTICLCFFFFNSMLMLFKAGNKTVLHLSHQIQRYATLCFETMPSCKCTSVCNAHNGTQMYACGVHSI